MRRRCARSREGLDTYYGTPRLRDHPRWREALVVWIRSYDLFREGLDTYYGMPMQPHGKMQQAAKAIRQ